MTLAASAWGLVGVPTFVQEGIQQNKAHSSLCLCMPFCSKAKKKSTRQAPWHCCCRDVILLLWGKRWGERGFIRRQSIWQRWNEKCFVFYFASLNCTVKTHKFWQCWNDGAFWLFYVRILHSHTALCFPASSTLEIQAIWGSSVQCSRWHYLQVRLLAWAAAGSLCLDGALGFRLMFIILSAASNWL